MIWILACLYWRIIRLGRVANAVLVEVAAVTRSRLECFRSSRLHAVKQLLTNIRVRVDQEFGDAHPPIVLVSASSPCKFCLVVGI